jgi:hypothetical protein
MSQNEKSAESGQKSGQSRHKVIADLHSGMVLLAPVATLLEDLPGTEADPESRLNVSRSNSGKG